MIRDGRVKFHPALEPLLVDIDSVEPAPWNYNNGDVELIAASIEKYGMWKPVQCQASTGFITMGNHTWMALKSLGATLVPLVPMEMDDATAKAVAIEDNEIARKALPDRGQLLELLGQIKEDTGELLLSLTEHDAEVLQALQDMPLDYDEFATWPTFSARLHPKVMKGLYEFTHEADNDSERLELLLRLAGWEG